MPRNYEGGATRTDRIKRRKRIGLARICYHLRLTIEDAGFAAKNGQWPRMAVTATESPYDLVRERSTRHVLVRL